ncbi:MAG: hypothetical protein PVH21_03565, partial [Myxococcales bacterium]
MKRVAFVASLMAAAAWIGCSQNDTDGTTFEQRQQALFDTTTQSSSRNTYSEIIRLHVHEQSPSTNVTIDESKIREDLDRMNDRIDTADFKLPGLLRL